MSKYIQVPPHEHLQAKFNFALQMADAVLQQMAAAQLGAVVPVVKNVVLIMTTVSMIPMESVALTEPVLQGGIAAVLTVAILKADNAVVMVTIALLEISA